MKQILATTILMAVLLCGVFVHAQQAADTNANTAVPTLINYSGTLTDLNGKPVTNITGVTFLLYKDEQGGAPLWLETQNITPDKYGHYTAVLGSTTAQGLPTDLFASGEARWLAVQPEGQAEQPRVLLVAVPYAMKAADAQTLGGLPASAFMLAGGAKENAVAAPSSAAATASTKTPPPANPDVTGKGTTDYIPMWDSASDIVNSVMFQSGSQIGIGTTTPAATLDVNGKSDVRDTLTLFPKSTYNTLAVSGTTFALSSTGKVTFVSGQTFPGAGTITGITTATGSGLSGGGTTGTLSLKIPAAGVTNTMLADSKITFPVTAPLTGGGAVSLGGTATTLALKPCAANEVYVSNGTTWSCAAAGTGTITGVTAGSDLTGGGTSGKVTLNLDTTKVPLLASANTFTANQTIDGLLSIRGGSGNAIDATSTNQSATTITGGATASTGSAWGVEGYTESSNSNAYGVYGDASSSSGSPIGVYGTASSSTTGIGVFGQNESESTTGANLISSTFAGGVGTWGDGGSTSANVGVVGSADDGSGAIFENNSSSFDTVFINALNSGADPLVAEGPGGECYVDSGGDLVCTGGVSAVSSVEGGKRTVALAAIESPMNWFEDAGSGRLVDGAALVALDPDYMQTANTEKEYQVFLTPYGDCKGLYVTNRMANSFEVRELGGGTSSLSFGYRIMAVRKNYETVRFKDRTRDMEHMNQMRERMKMGAGHPVSHDPVKKSVLAPGSMAAVAERTAVAR